MGCHGRFSGGPICCFASRPAVIFDLQDVEQGELAAYHPLSGKSSTFVVHEYVRPISHQWLRGLYVGYVLRCSLRGLILVQNLHRITEGVSKL
jgi:hypothetical protein